MTDDVHEITRSVDLDAAPDAVWEVVADPEARRGWLDDEDAASRVLRVDRIDEGRSLSWTWWRPDDAAGASRVEVTLTELDDGGTRLVVTERMAARTTLRASASAAAATAGSAAAATAWDYRLLGVELLLASAGVCVA